MTFSLDQRDIKCPRCGAYSAPHETHCPECGYPIAPPTPPMKTGPLTRPPFTLAFERQGEATFDARMTAILQFLPSAACLSLPLLRPLILGRGEPPDLEEEYIDLTEMNALQHGVSRCHCRLFRRGDQLVAVDLGSTNGSYLNSEPMLPHREYIIAHGDKLILGSLHLTVAFNALPTVD